MCRYEEVRTSGLVAERLKSFGVDRIELGVATTGVVATIKGRKEASNSEGTVRSIGLRADMVRILHVVHARTHVRTHITHNNII